MRQRGPSQYTQAILEIAPDADAYLVEEWMRLRNPTLDHLTPSAFAEEVEIALACIEEVGYDEACTIVLLERAA